MSGHEKSRAVVLAALMVLSVATMSVAFTGSALADDRTEDLEIEVVPDTITVGENPDTVTVTVTNADDANETYSYTVTNPTGIEVVTGDSAESQFSFALNPDSEGDYTVEVTAVEDDPTGTENDTATATVTAAYELAISPSEVAAGDYQQVVTGVLTNDQGEGVDNELLELRDPSGTVIDSSISDAQGRVSFQFEPDQTGEYPIENADSGVTYETITVTPNELTVESNRSALLLEKQESVDFTVFVDGEQLNGTELLNLDATINQSGQNVASSGEYVDTNDDGNVETYRVDIDPNADFESPIASVNATFSNETFTGTTSIEVLTPTVQTNVTSPLTKGVHTGVSLTATDPRDGEPLNEQTVFGISPDGGTFEAVSDEVQYLGGNATSTATGVEIEDDEIAFFQENSTADENDIVDINATVFAFNSSAGDSDEAFNTSVILHVAAVANEEPEEPTLTSVGTLDAPEETDNPLGFGTSYIFEPLNADASPDEISVTGESAVTVTTQNAKGESFNRSVTLDGAGVDVSGDTGADGSITFSVDPTQTGDIAQLTDYDGDLVTTAEGGQSDAPAEVQTDTVEVVQQQPEEPVGNIDAPDNTMFGEVTVGDSKTQTVTVVNEGEGDVTVDLTDVRGTDADEFSVVGGGAPFTLAPGEEQDITVQFSPDSEGDKSARLRIDTENDGVEIVQLTGTGVAAEQPPEEPENSTLRIEGNGQYAFYAFRAEGNVAGEGLTSEDTIEGSTASGAVAGGSDSYTFDGDLELLYVGQSADVFLNGEQIDPADYESIVRIDGDGSLSTYEFGVTGEITDTRGLTSEDNADEENGTASGAVAAGSESYTFTGTFEDFDLTGDATVILNGQPVDVSMFDVPDEDDQNTLRIDGSGQYAFYAFSATSEVDGQGTTSEDTVEGNTVSGAVGAGEDTYTFEGELATLYVEQSADVFLNGAQINPADYESIVTIDGDGSLTTYEFAVSGEITDAQGTTSEDMVNQGSASGAVAAGQESYTFTGFFQTFNVDGDATLVLNGQEIEEDDV